MCGFAGISSQASNSGQDLKTIAGRMVAAIAHRGPDGDGAWADQSLGSAVAHQRLAVIDLSSAGRQPMHSTSGRYVIAFNGEIYNHLKIRSELESRGLAPAWRGHCDTETLLAAVEAWGLEAALQRCNGMWAIALIDCKLGRLHLARDRFGEKPIYWGLTGSNTKRVLVYGSELAALRSYPGFNNRINQYALSELIRLGQIPAPFSIYSGIAKLPAGHWVSIPLPLDINIPMPNTQPWWELRDAIQAGYRDPCRSEEEALELLEHVLKNAVNEQANADVPLGAFLSGGIDSSLVTALMQSQSSRPTRTFTVGFEESGYNEAQNARAVANYLGTEHNEIMLTSTDALALIERLPVIYSEPFADSSQIATHLVCREAKRGGLTVALSGDGGDELFGGYNRYTWGPRIWYGVNWIPHPLRSAIGSAITKVSPSLWDAVGSSFKITQLAIKANKISSLMQHAKSSDDLYRFLVSICQEPSSLMQGEKAWLDGAEDNAQVCSPCLGIEPVAQMMAWDALGYLPNDLLVKVDRAAMATGLETRTPFLDHRVAYMAWRLPMHMKIRAGTSKWALRQILYKHVPRELVERPKAGFAVPIGKWLRGPLRDWAEELLRPERLIREGYLKPERIKRLWDQHLSGRYEHADRLWTVLMWQAWLDQWE